MEVVVIILPLALLMAALSVWVFARSVRSGQFDDLDTPPLRILADDADLEHRPSPDPQTNKRETPVPSASRS